MNLSSSVLSGMHKKSLEMAKKGSSTSESDSTRSDSFCEASERRGGADVRVVDREAAEEVEEPLGDEEEDEEVAIDLSSSSKVQQHLEGEGLIKAGGES